MGVTDKPISLPIKDYLVRKTSVKKMLPENIVSAIIDDAFKGANEATQSNNEVEISGLGKFMLSEKKAKDGLESMTKIKAAYLIKLQTETDEIKRKNLLKRVASADETIEYLERKLEKSNDKRISDNRRMEESSNTPKETETVNKGSIGSEDGNLQGMSIELGECQETPDNIES